MHLTTPQLTMIAARVAEGRHGGHRHGVKSSIDDLTEPAPGAPTLAEAAELLNTSTKSYYKRTPTLPCNSKARWTPVR